MATTQTDPKDSAFKNFVDLLAVYAECDSRLKDMAARAQSSFLEIVDEHRADYADLQEKMTQAETALEHIALAHPEWFATSRSIKTPYGVVKFTSSKSLEVANEEASILLIEKHVEDPEERAKYLRTETKLNLKNLHELSDARLKQFRIERVQDDNFSVKAGSIDLGKAVKEAAEKEAK
ncbi:hypothetical protein BH09VER1_BH09VER1_28710 [soil metagenome]